VLLGATTEGHCTLPLEELKLRSLAREPLLSDRVERLIRIPAVGPITALTVRCGLPVIRPEPRNPESLVSTLFGGCFLENTQAGC
jgi:hypothetical protein